MSHRGPDDQGIYEDETIQLGFRRLSIIDLQKGSQPFFSEDKNFALIFNGEIYNYRTLRETLTLKGVKFKTNSDTEVLLQSLIYWDIEEALNKLNGMFAFALYNFKSKKLILARDRFGIKPLYFCNTKNNKGIVFSSEIKSLIKTNVVNRDINYDAISSYLSFRYSYGVGNLFKNIKKLNPGEYLILKDQNLHKKTYWKIPMIFETNEVSSEKILLEKLDELMCEVVKDHLESDVSVGSLLSGGLDSSLITSIMSKYQNSFNTYSASFDEDGYDENKFATLISNQINSNHLNINLNSKKYFEKLDRIIEHKYLPLNIPHEVALYELFKNIKLKNKVVISGEGADEMFGGYGRVQGAGFDFLKIQKFDKFSKFFGKKNVYNFFNAQALFSGEKLSRKEHFFRVYNWFSMEQKQKILSKDFLNKISNDKKSESFWEDEFNEINIMKEENKFIYLFQKYHLQCLLDRLDLMSMAHGVEARVPFCDHRIITFLSKVPYDYKIRWKSKFSKFKASFSLSNHHSEKLNISKYLLRKYSFKYIPKEIINRDKLGFPVPLDNWIDNNEDKKYIKDILLDPQTIQRGLFDKNELENLINNKENIDYDFWGKKIWMLLNIEIWLRKVS